MKIAEIKELLCDDNKLQEMSQVMAALSVKDACDKICDTVLELLR